MTERPILFSGSMVRAILSGSKTQTRRVVKPGRGQEWLRPSTLLLSPRAKPVLIDGQQWAQFAHPEAGKMFMGIQHDEWSPLGCVRCPHGAPGDRLWVREAFDPIYPQDPHYNGGRPIEYDYRATYQHGYRLGDSLGIKKRWTPSIYMPREASRITLQVTDVRVERLQDISEADAIAEGIEADRQPGDKVPLWRNYATGGTTICPQHSYRTLWESINGDGSWSINPWVWVVSSQRVEVGND